MTTRDKWIDRVSSAVEYFIAFLFLKGAYDVYDAPAVDTPLPFTDLLATRAAIIIYGISWIILAGMLIYAKLRKRRKLHGWALMGMYLNALYIVLLAWFVEGWNNGLIFSISIVFLIGLLYLLWKYRVIYDKLPDKEE
jgi:hypothetical protein